MTPVFWITIFLALITPFQHSRAATGPYVIAVDGLTKQEVGVSWTEWLNPLSWGKSKVEKGYLAKALSTSPEIGQSGAEIHAFAWSRDPGDSSRYIRKLTKEIGEVYQKQTRGQRPLVIMAHSWGTVLSYATLHALKGDVTVNGFISLGSPLNPSPLSLGKGFLTLETLKEFLPPGLLFNNLKKPASLKGPWFNYFAEKDLYSSPIGSAQNDQIDYVPGSSALRVIQAPETEKWHQEYYTNPAILSRISDNLKYIASGSQRAPASTSTAPADSNKGQTPVPTPETTASAMTVMGRLSWYGEKNKTFWCIEPWVVCQGNNCTSIFISWPNGDERANKVAIQRRRALKLLGTTFWLYDRGSEIGTLEVQAGVIPHSGESILPGKVTWKGRPLNTEEIKDRKIIALSRPIPQNFWLSQDRLTPEQLSGFKQMLTAALTRTPKGFKGGVSRKQGVAQRPTGKIAEKKFMLLDLDQDGQPEVYGELKSEGKPCTSMVADLFASWQGRWNVLRQATYWAYCPQAEAVGDHYFEVIPVDLNGDGRAEVFIQHGFYETWGISLFHYQGGRLTKQLEFGEGGL